MTKTEAINLLGGTPLKAAKALGFRSVQAIYVWPDDLSVSQSDRVRGAVQRLKEQKKRTRSDAEK
jgi:threonine dehydratase